MRTIAVFYGGKSCEHEISVLTGLLACQLLQSSYTVVPVYVSLENVCYFAEKATGIADYRDLSRPKGKVVRLVGRTLYYWGRRVKKCRDIDCALNCCHGGLGEGGGLAAVLEWNGLPSASPAFPQSGIFQDKYLTKLIIGALGIRVAEGVKVTEETFAKRKTFALKWLERKLGYPMIVKPNHLGSSIGISVVNAREELQTALAAAFVYDTSVLVERYLPDKRDINCAAYADESGIVLSNLEETNSDAAFLSYDEKYLVKRNATLPAKVDVGLEEQIKSATKKIYKALELSGIIRIDYIISGEKVYFNELNVIPGSLAYYLFSEKLSDAKKLLAGQIEYALSKNEWKPKEILISDILKRSDLFYAGSCKIR